MTGAPADVLEVDATVAHRYRILGYRGNRGFGQVYEAEDSAMDVHVTLMRLHREFSEPETRESFYETRATAAVEDPRIVDITDYGEDLDGRLFLVMPWIADARPLEALVATGHNLGWARIQTIVSEIGEALRAAHAKGVLHGALDLSRVLIDPDEGVHVVDFGLAPALTRPGARATTNTSKLPGNHHYLAPEQIRGEGSIPRSDIYALGVMLWELLSGAPPFTGDPLAVTHAHLQRPLPELSRRGAPAELEPLLQLTLTKDVGERIQSVDEFLALLRAMPRVGASSRSEPAPAPTPQPRRTPLPAAQPAATRRPAPASAAPSPAAPSPASPSPASAPRPSTAPPPASAPPPSAAAAPPSTPPPSAAPAPPSAPPPSAASAPPSAPPSAAPTPEATTPPAHAASTSAPAVSPRADSSTLHLSPPAAQHASAALEDSAQRDPAGDESEPARQPTPEKRKKRLGKLELAIIVFLILDLLIVAAWLLFGRSDEPELATDEHAQVAPDQPELDGQAAPDKRTTRGAASPSPSNTEAATASAATGSARSANEAIAELLPEPDSVGPTRPLEQSLGDSDFRETMVASRNKILDACLDTRMRRTLKVSLKVDPSGEVTFARVIGGLADTQLGRCVIKQTYRMEFPATHEGGSHVYTLRLR